MTEPPRTGGRVALAATLAIQVYASLAASAAAVLAPVIAPEFALPSNLVGVFVALVYAGSMIASLAAGGLIARYGPIRLSQIAVLLCAIGLVLIAVAALHPAAVALLAIAPVIVGAGYGPITPASSQVLARTAPPGRMALTFSIKQTGVPAGAALGGAMLPALALTFGWRYTLVATALAGIVVTVAAQPLRSDLDRGRDRTRRAFSVRGLIAPLRATFADATLFELSITAFFYAAMQGSLTAFLVVYLTDALGRSLVAAGLSLTVTTIGGVAGRLLWGLLADTRVRPRLMLASIGIVAGLLSFAVAAYPPDAPAAPLLVLCALFGATAIGWNGVQLAEVARHAPQGQAAAITGAAGFVGFSGIVIGPPLFGALAAATGDYRTGFVALGVATLACGTWLIVRHRRRAR